jgi:eukaryotic-like serine/threonine-protein kinase
MDLFLMMLEEFKFTTAKISNMGKIDYYPRQGKFINIELDPSTPLTLVLASDRLFSTEPNSSENIDISDTEIQNSDTIRPPFLISKYPITQKQWHRVMKRLQLGDCLGFKKPILTSWTDAKEFCDRLSQKEGREYRLPYESEWEFACRAGSQDDYSFGTILTPELANFGNHYSTADKYNQIMNVGMFPPNDFGIHDMHGNVWEWCLNEVNDTSLRSIRGGAYYSSAEDCCCSYRGRMRYWSQDVVVGFRIVSPLSNH